MGEELEDVIRRADRLLYVAKRNGRNGSLVDWLRIELQVETVAEAVGQPLN
jgi:predicted signal transduction protein with EAL and GGDEF domain